MGSMDQGYWMDKSSNLIDVSFKFHSDIIIQFPKLFGKTKKDIDTIFNTFNESQDTEGNQRELLCKEQYLLGWVRIRKYKYYWWLQCDNYQQRKTSINEFIENQVYGKIVTRKMDSFNDDIVLIDTKKSIMSQFDRVRISSDCCLEKTDLFYNMEQKNFIEEIIYNKSKEIMLSTLKKLQEISIYDAETYFKLFEIKEGQNKLNF